MRKIILNLLLPVSLLAACNQKGESVAGPVPGTYVNHAESAYSVADDTLIIAKLNNTYAVNRKTGFRRILNGQLQAAQYKAGSFTGVWDKDKQVLQLAQNGIILVFDGDSLRVQNSIYHKLPGGRGL